MVLAICIDDDNGLMFNNRRVSSDKAVIEDLVRLGDPQIITISTCSAMLFRDYQDRVEVKEDVFESASGFCFAEDGDFLSVLESVKKLIVYKWNRRYPSDRKFPLDAYRSRMTLESTKDIEGHSHPCITREVYIR